MRILVAGGAGFIGSHLCDALLALGHAVVAYDNLITGLRTNLSHLSSCANFQFVELDVTGELPQERWDAIFHLASPASPEGYGRYPIETLLVNSVGTYNLLELARRSDALYLLTSTSEVYGDPLEHPQTESYWGNVNPIGPRACYDEGMRFAEAITINYVQQYGLNGRIVRIFNTYGPRNDPEDGRIIPNFISQALRGEPITIHGDGSQTRSFCYVSDLVDGLVRAMFREGTKGEVFNLGNPDERSVLEVAQTVGKLTKTSSPIVHVPARQEDIARRKPDIARARNHLGWQPGVSLEQGLDSTIAWFRVAMAQPREGSRG